MRRAALLAGAVALLLPLAVQAEPRTHVIEIANMAFGPAPADVRVGDTVVWRNKDLFRHTATVRGSGGFDVDLPAGAEGSTVVGEAGTVDYFCRFHPAMTGKIAVAP